MPQTGEEPKEMQYSVTGKSRHRVVAIRAKETVPESKSSPKRLAPKCKDLEGLHVKAKLVDLRAKTP